MYVAFNELFMVGILWILELPQHKFILWLLLPLQIPKLPFSPGLRTEGQPMNCSLNRIRRTIIPLMILPPVYDSMFSCCLFNFVHQTPQKVSFSTSAPTLYQVQPTKSDKTPLASSFSLRLTETNYCQPAIWSPPPRHNEESSGGEVNKQGNNKRFILLKDL